MDNLFRLFSLSPTLVDINVINCPVELGFSSMNIFMAQVLIKKTAVKRFCKVQVTDQHLFEAVYLAQHQWQKAEEERKRIEEEERKKAEAEEAEG
mmetsp:Transcript_23074/g.35723  ORF Transcript_23074/g.35723 Transcript_23074/m.35723 type:complete len:95 (+) Transcript_23074:668-952(+)